MTVNEDVIAKAKAERESAEAAARQASHAESAARIADLKAAAEFEEWKLSAPDRKRSTELATETTKLDNLAKLQTAVGNITPDLKGLERGKTTVPDEVLYSTLVATRALTDAASKVAKVVKSTTTRPYRIFLTSDPDLLSRDAQLRSLMSRLTTLTTFVKRFSASGETLNDQPDPEEKRRSIIPASATISGATALAKLIPGFLELLAVNRTLTAKPITIEDEQATTAVAGALATIEGDDFLKLDDTRFLGGDTTLQRQRDELEEASIELQMKVAEYLDKQDSAWLAEAPIVIKACQEALATLDTTPPGAKMSPLASAMASELIRESDMEFILIIQPAGGSTTQLFSDRPLAMKDPLYIAGTVALSYRLVRRDTSQVVCAGVVAGSAELTGEVGRTINLDEET